MTHTPLSRVEYQRNCTRKADFVAGCQSQSTTGERVITTTTTRKKITSQTIKIVLLERNGSLGDGFLVSTYRRRKLVSSWRVPRTKVYFAVSSKAGGLESVRVSPLRGRWKFDCAGTTNLWSSRFYGFNSNSGQTCYTATVMMRLATPLTRHELTYLQDSRSQSLYNSLEVDFARHRKRVRAPRVMTHSAGWVAPAWPTHTLAVVG